jgi:hypothetical protein
VQPTELGTTRIDETRDINAASHGHEAIQPALLAQEPRALLWIESVVAALELQATRILFQAWRQLIELARE